MENILSVNQLNKFFGKKHVLQNVSFNVAPGEVVGLIGPNGAGKTTIMKAVLGLFSCESGQITIKQNPITVSAHQALDNVGALIEYPGIYPFLTGYQHLELFATGTDKQQRIEQVIDQLKIGAYVRRKAKSYSLGMKQKLGIALALLNHPELVILDEPMNGLDPQATRDLRDLILSLAKQGTSFLISSHILSELEKIVQEVVVIDQGKIIKQASIEELAATGKSFIFLKTDNNTQAQQVLTAAGYQVELTAKQLKLEQNDESELAKIIQVLTNQQINILDVQHQHSDLETSLLALLGKDQLQQTKE
ncbi:MAG: ATP-binding cassette domain-containing protein [Liquorilactobacillus nagelii]|jgi:ABC-2 type transport system ATP-binding protein|uniref:ABC transporter ATP-binding protein n=1 Tax=Liquorilactobacillus nagelii TaxID=82688 RepID=A0A3Q8CF43_9LACO|nr:ATP-binding cassette domain-containing protein [Liquorilactobacillus nagelii]AUJ32081.1 ABC transporter ATP-binding protein [Liquorilactobacillus nagelii]MCC7615240.1 ABC transporter ATP-binding protein [Liquorilactobacillus nagelii]MCI1632613.1 ATP-binding cassette domain-containing protein [Liquorilactobacillus nagelii]MCI1920728.1 ATP-binding cassette domain-containing protein [Liquorilactobacillus nagelii]MCI1977626.1 ATP-binding cassette domain-containing protein [Liquorilactobacillus 